MWSYWSPIGYLPGWRIWECWPDMEGTGEIKYPGQTETSTAALRLTEGSVKPRGRKPREKKITWSSRLGVVHGKHLQAKNCQRRNGTGRLNGCRRKRVQRNTSTKLCTGTWNVKTLLKPGKMQGLAGRITSNRTSAK